MDEMGAVDFEREKIILYKIYYFKQTQINILFFLQNESKNCKDYSDYERRKENQKSFS